MTQHLSLDEINIPNFSTMRERELLEWLVGEQAALLEALGSASDLAGLSYTELLAQGVEPSSALRLMAGFELARRSRVAAPLPEALHAPEDAYAYIAPLIDDAEREHFVVIVLDVRNRPRRVARVAQGAIDHCAVDPRAVFAPAIREHGTAVLIAHNHPSGDPTPSREDVELTQRLVRAGNLLGVPVLDHMIIASGPHVRQDARFVSLAEIGAGLGLEPSDRVSDDAVPQRQRKKTKGIGKM